MRDWEWCFVGVGVVLADGASWLDNRRGAGSLFKVEVALSGVSLGSSGLRLGCVLVSGLSMRPGRDSSGVL